jgi:tetratricopeptide (TPR) repeat protein
MRKYSLSLFALVLLSLALFQVGCKEGPPQTELDRFVMEISRLDEADQEPRLRELAAGETSEAAFAHYMIGNEFYKEAGQTAIDVGWNGGEVNALLDSAEVYFNHAVAKDSTFLEAMVNLGSLWDDRSDQMGSRQERQERVENAKKFYNMALAVDPHDEKARCNLGALYLRQRQTADALAEFRKVLEHDPRSSLAHYNLAIMFAEQKIYREAITEWELAVKYDPDGDIGERSRENIKIVKELMNSPTPDSVK